ncbi:MAG TPA: LamG domain-containing protein [Planctomycetes bacterium]|nr:LamG domain-containing protein [Planctomycetota bacterium]
MPGSKLALASMIAVFLLCCQVQAAITSHWNVPGKGQWGDANSWNPTIVPDNGEVTFDVIIDPAGDLGYYEEVKVGLQDNHRINQLSCFGVADLESWGGRNELTVESGLTNYGYLEIEKIEIKGNVTNIDGAELCLCEMDIEGILYNEPGAMIEVEDGVSIESKFTTAGSFLVNYGTVDIIPYGELWVEDALDNTGEMNVYGGICGCDNVFNNPGVISGFGVIGSGGVFTNYGEITAFGGSLAIWCHYLTNGGTLNNTPLSSLQIDSKYDVWNKGTIYARTGGGVAFVCSLVNDTSGLIELLGGTLAAAAITQTAGAEFTGFGSIAGNIVIQAGAGIELTGPTNIIGDVTIASGATLVVSAGQTMITGLTTNDGTIRLSGGTVLFTGGYSGSGEIIDPIGHWPMDDDAASATVVDIAGHNNATLFDAGGIATTEAHNGEGKIGGCLTFDGIDDYIAINGLTSYDTFTYAAWVKFDNLSGRQKIFCGGGIFYIRLINGYMDVYSLGLSDNYMRMDSFKPVTGEWYHFAYSYNGSSKKFYVDGLLEYQESANGVIDAFASMMLGAHYMQTREFLSGSMDNVMVFNKALSAGQIEAMCNE